MRTRAASPDVARVVGHAAAVLLLALLAWQADTSAAHKSPTFDETVHLVAGLSVWQTGDFRLNPESGVLPQLWAALPLWLAGAHPPDLEGEAWRLGDDWGLGQQLLYDVGNDPQTLLRSARRMIVALGVALGLLVYLWSLRLFGPGGALVSLWLLVFCPNLLAHTRLVTADLALALTLPVAVLAVWAALVRVTPLRLAGAGLAVGAALLTKFTGLLLAPMALLLAGIRWLSPRAPQLALGKPLAVEARGPRAAVLLGALLWIGAGALAVVWAVHGFEFRRGEPVPLGWERIEAVRSLPTALVLWARDLRLAPETWLYGLGYTLETTGERVAFAAGSWGTTGWWWYFPFAVAVKTPLGTLGIFALAALAGGLAWRDAGAGRGPDAGLGHGPDAGLGHGPDAAGGRWRALEQTAPLWVLLLVYLASSVTSSLNIGVRHLLPAFAAAWILAGAAGRFARSRAGLALLAGLLAATAAESIAARPHYLAFFNLAAGGRDAGPDLLIDSNLDWGQDLPGLADWLAAERTAGDTAPCYLSYFGSVRPEAHGVDCIRLPGFFDHRRPRRRYALEPGLYAVSATMLRSLHVPPAVRGPWNAAREAEWRQLLAAREAAPPRADAPWTPGDELHEQLRFARLMAWLRGREPDARVGGSILVYRLDAEALHEALAGPAPEIPR